MKRFPLRWLSLLLPLSLVFTSLRADTITLNSGEKVSGKVLSETDNDVTVQVQISSSIKDERVISKSEIQNIEKASEDSQAFDLIKALRVNEDHSYPAESYDQMLTTLGNFIQQYPLSEHLADVKTQLDALQEEQKRVQNGELKFHSQWLTSAEAAKEKYEIEAAQTLELLKTYGGRSDYSNALNTFELLRAKYPGSRAYPDAVDYTLGFLPSLLADAQRRAASLKAEQETFIKNMKSREEPSRSQFISAAQREQANYSAMVANSREIWKPYVGRSNTSLALYIQQLPTAISALASIDTGAMRRAIALVAQARTAMEAKDLAAAQGDLKRAATLWSASDEVKTATLDFNKMIEDAKVEAAKADAIAAASASAKPVATPEMAVAASTPTPVAPESGSFFFSLKGALIILAAIVVIAGGASVLAKRKKSEDDEA